MVSLETELKQKLQEISALNRKCDGYIKKQGELSDYILQLKKEINEKDGRVDKLNEVNLLSLQCCASSISFHPSFSLYLAVSLFLYFSLLIVSSETLSPLSLYFYNIIKKNQKKLLKLSPTCNVVSQTK